MPTKQLTLYIPEPVLDPVDRVVWICNPKCPLCVDIDHLFCQIGYDTIRPFATNTPGPKCPQYQGSQGDQSCPVKT